MPDPSVPNAIFRDREEFRSYHIGEQRAFWVLALFYGTAAVSILLTRFAVALPYDVGLPIAIFAFVVIGWAQYSIGNGMHEAMHRNLLNYNDDRIASLIAAYPIGFTLAYRDTHFRHHRFLG